MRFESVESFLARGGVISKVRLGFADQLISNVRILMGVPVFVCEYGYRSAVSPNQWIANNVKPECSGSY